MRPTRVLALVVVAGSLSGCGASEQDQVRAKVKQFVTAAAHRNYATICTQVLAPSLLTRLAAGGVSCEQAMQIGFGGVSRPALNIGKVTVSGSSASVITLSSAQGQQAALTAIALIKTAHGWRITSVGNPPVSRSGR